MKKRHATIAAVLSAIIVAAIASAQSVGVSLTKDATLRGTGSSGSALGVNTSTLAGSGLTAPSATTMAVTGGSGVQVSADQVDIDPAYWQRRISSTACAAAGSAISAVAQDGSPTCITTGTTYTAGDGLTLTANDFDVGAGAGISVAADSVSVNVAGIVWSISQIGTLPIGIAGDPDDHVLNNWAPTGLATAPILQVTAADDFGSLITGIDAIGTSLPVGTRRTLCNTNAPQDDGILALQAEDSRSTANNRIWTPGYGRDLGQTAVDRYTIGPSSCVDLVYMQPNQADSTIKRWLVVDTTRMAQLATKGFSLFPVARPAALVFCGHVSVADQLFVVPASAAGDTCESAAHTKGSTYSMIITTTTTSTGATITGMEYTGDTHPDGQGPVKWILNLGPGPLTLKNLDAGSSVGNQFQFGGQSLADVVLNVGDSVTLYHPRSSNYWYQIGGFDPVIEGRDLRMMGGATVSGTVPSTNASLDVAPSFSGRTSNYTGIRYLNSGTFDTTGGALLHSGISMTCSATRSAGVNTIDQACAEFSAVSGAGVSTNLSLKTGAGNVYFGFGIQMATFFVNSADTSFSGNADVQGNFRVGQSAFGGTERWRVFGANGHHRVLGTTPSDSVACDGSTSATVAGTDTAFKVTTGTGATSCTMTFASTYTVAPVCTVMPEGTTTLPTCTISATAITCTTVAGGTAYNFRCDGVTGGT
jgi:hypothetical protein